ncbi:hypothetical protein [Fischerella sp. PCC 9605]|uniref:hypothetical protein n=1 Tax=Fischerella sp. PCC 9605 TaxID=1173024 RepID=UPI0012DEB213|nr:hypothetical protein [Fischerella sp. PCC 9605]
MLETSGGKLMLKNTSINGIIILWLKGSFILSNLTNLQLYTPHIDRALTCCSVLCTLLLLGRRGFYVVFNT